LVIDEGKAVQAAEKQGRLVLSWDASECFIPDEQGRPTAATRVYLGMDGVMTPMVTQAEKDKRRAKVKDKRKRRGRKCQPLPRARPGSRSPWLFCLTVARRRVGMPASGT
jgi:hypothetical protein